MTINSALDPHAIGTGFAHNVQKDELKVHFRKALPGVIIFVHGVNSTGEWYESAEAGLCKGLNTRLRREEKHVVFPREAGQMTKAEYLPELLPDGFIDPKLDAESFVTLDNYSPVIRFRWGYKADLEQIAEWGGNIWLDEFDSWGGGPFANGCAALPDCFNNGLVTDLFLGLEAHDLNATDRDVYACPGRHYYAHAAWRLAKLVALVRKTHRELPDGDGTECPVTLLCHSQGNMIGLVSAFVGQNALGGEGVADSYVLSNPPYSLDEATKIDSLGDASLGSTQDGRSSHGRITRQARLTTLNRVFEFVKRRAGRTRQTPEDIDKMSGNIAPRNGDSPASVAHEQGQDRINTARVFLYSNPHDQVISAATVRGMGWRGVGSGEFLEMRAAPGVFFQRVFAQGFQVGGGSNVYNAWEDRWNKSLSEKEYWYPRPPQVTFQLKNIVQNPQKSIAAKLGWTLVGLVAIPFEFTLSATTQMLSVNAYPPKGWQVPINAPKLPTPIKPRGKDGSEKTFDEGKQSAVQEINRDDASRAKSGDAYDHHRQSALATPDKPQAAGDKDSEAQLRYEHNARLRMTARRSGDQDLAGNAGNLKPGEALPTQFGEWAEETRFEFLTRGVDQNSTDHSTILTNAFHAEHVLAYDVPVGYCSFMAKDWAQLRMAADWRWCMEVKDKEFADYGLYFRRGNYDDVYPHKHPDYQPTKAAALGMDVTRAKSGPPAGPTPSAQRSSLELPYDFGR